MYNETTIEFIKQRHRDYYHVPDTYLHLYTNNSAVDQANDAAVIALEGAFTRYHAVDNGTAAQLKMTGLPRTLSLKTKTRCMLLHNLDVQNGWTNGTICTAIDLSQTNYVIVQRSDGATRVIHPITRDLYRTAYSRTQIPLVPCYAANIHKVQSLTLSNGVAISLADRFRSPGQLYVACSRVKSAEQICFFGLDKTFETTTNEQISAFLGQLSQTFQ